MISKIEQFILFQCNSCRILQHLLGKDPITTSNISTSIRSNTGGCIKSYYSDDSCRLSSFVTMHSNFMNRTCKEIFLTF